MNQDSFSIKSKMRPGRVNHASKQKLVTDQTLLRLSKVIGDHLHQALITSNVTTLKLV